MRYALLLLFLAVAAAGGETTRVRLLDFEAPETFKAIRVGADCGDTAFSRESDPQGRAALRLKLPSIRDGGVRWPYIQISGGALRETDWRPFHRLCFRSENLAPEPGMVIISVLLPSRPVLPYFRYEAGTREWSVELPEHMRKAGVRGLRIGASSAPYPIDLRLGSMELELDHELLAAEIAAFRKSAPGFDASALDRGDALTRARALLELKARHEKLLAEQEQKNNAALRRRFPPHGLGYAGVSALTKVYRDRSFPGTVGKLPRLQLARGETESMQLVLHSGREVRQLRIKTSGLTGPDGARLDDLSCAMVGYVNPPETFYPVREKATWRPDPLLPWPNDFTLEAGVWQPVWFDVRTAEDQAPGLYRGTIEVSGEGVPVLRIPVEVEVWNFTLPLRLSFPSIISYQNNELHHVYVKDPEARAEYLAYREGRLTDDQLGEGARQLRRFEQQTRDLLLDHRIMPDALYCSVQRMPKIEDLVHGIRRGGGMFNLLYISGVNGIRAGEPYPAETKKMLLDALRRQVEKCRAAGILQYAYIYAFDEVKEQHRESVRDILTAIKAEFPEIPIVTTMRDYSFGPDFGVRDLVDVWTPLTPKYEEYRRNVDEVRQAGKKVWYYVADIPTAPYANLNIEDPATAPRLLTGFMARREATEGFLYWAVANWKGDSELISRGPLTEHNGVSRTRGYSGSGMLLYPSVDGPLASLRLKYLRDGLEDYEYTELLRRLDPARLTPEQRQRHLALLSIPDAVCRSLTRYDLDGDRLLDYRRQLGAFLSEVNAR